MERDVPGADACRLVQPPSHRRRLTERCQCAWPVAEVVEIGVAEDVGDMPVGQHQLAVPGHIPRSSATSAFEAMKDVMIASMKATGGRSSSGEVDGSQYLRFTFETAEFDCI